MLDRKFVMNNLDFIRFMCTEIRHMKDVSFLDVVEKHTLIHKKLNQKLMQFNTRRNSGENVKRFIKVIEPKVKFHEKILDEALLEIPNIPAGSEERYIFYVLKENQKEINIMNARSLGWQMEYWSFIEDLFLHDFQWWMNGKPEEDRKENRIFFLYDFEYRVDDVQFLDRTLVFNEKYNDWLGI